MFFSGFELAFWSGEFPQLLETSSVGLVLTFTGIGEVLGKQLACLVANFLLSNIDLLCLISGGVGIGRLSDRIGRQYSLIIGGFAYGIGLALSVVLKV